MLIRDIKLVQTGMEQSVAIEFGDGQVRTLTAQQLYDASRSMGQGGTDVKSAAQRRAEEMLAMRKGRR